MSDPDSTRWTLIRSAAEGDAAARDTFARLYEPVIRAYLGARWRSSSLLREIDDAVQEVFVDCFKAEGVLERVEDDRPGGFRAFLYAVVRNAARHAETRVKRRREWQPPSGLDMNEVEGHEEELSREFDRAWALAHVREALEALVRRARNDGEDARRRVDILRLRFEDDLPIREIARRWDADPARLHRDYARARREYEAALLEVVSDGRRGSKAAVEECRRLLAHLR